MSESRDAVPSGPPAPVRLGPGPPAALLAVVAPLVAVGLVTVRAVLDGLASTPDDPAPPWVLAVLTVVLALGVSYRAATQRAVLRADVLVCRNVLTSFEVPWDRVERLERRHRGGVVTVDVVVRGLRRSLRLGAATRFAGDEADAVADVLRAHPGAAARLDVTAP